MESEQESVESLLRWAAKLGVSDSLRSEFWSSCLGRSLAVSYFPDAGGRGLAAVRDLRKGELILKVPKSALITTENLSLEDYELRTSLSSNPSLSSNQKLTVCLLYEMGKAKASRWFPYLQNLPQSYDILATFGEFEKQALQVDDAIWATEKAISKARTEWKEAYALLEEIKLKGQPKTFRSWLWASATISSRALHIPWDEAGCLCPVGDLFNYAAPGENPSDGEDTANCIHSSSSQLTLLRQNDTDELDEGRLDLQFQRLTDGGYEKDVSAYCFYAREDYKKGEQVLLCYGTYTNLELFEHYGFLLPSNPNDKAFIPLEPEIHSTISWPKEFLYIHQDGKPSFALLSALRLWLTPRNKRRTLGHLAYSGSQLSTENEIAVVKWILKNCSAVLKNMPTSIEEDGLILEQICRIQDVDKSIELGKEFNTFGGEIRAFLEAKGLKNGDLLGKKCRRLMEKWKLAVEWRIMYKKILVDCICYCTEVVNDESTKLLLPST